VVDRLIDEGGIGVGMLNANVVRSMASFLCLFVHLCFRYFIMIVFDSFYFSDLYRLGYIYFDVPIDDTDSFTGT